MAARKKPVKDPANPPAAKLRQAAAKPRQAVAAFVPNRDQKHVVMVLSANMASNDLMAEALNISVPTLRKFFGKEIKNGLDNVNAQIGSVVVREALAGNMSAARLWLSTHGGPQWQAAKGSDEPPDRDDYRPDEIVTFYLPQNGRDQPEEEPGGLTIDAEPLRTGTDA